MNALPFQLQGGLVRSRRSTTTTGQAFSLFYCCLNDVRPPNIVVMYVMTPSEASVSFPMSLAFCADERREERCFTRSWNFYRQIHGLLPMVLRRETRNLKRKKKVNNGAYFNRLYILCTTHSWVSRWGWLNIGFSESSRENC